MNTLGQDPISETLQGATKPLVQTVKAAPKAAPVVGGTGLGLALGAVAAGTLAVVLTGWALFPGTFADGTCAGPAGPCGRPGGLEYVPSGGRIEGNPTNLVKPKYTRCYPTPATQSRN